MSSPPTSARSRGGQSATEIASVAATEATNAIAAKPSGNRWRHCRGSFTPSQPDSRISGAKRTRKIGTPRKYCITFGASHSPARKPSTTLGREAITSTTGFT